MPVEGFDDASKSISKRGSARRKASRDAYSNSVQANAEKKKAAAAAKKVATAAEEADFGKYATDYQKGRYKANRTFRAGGSRAKFRSGVVAKGKAAEAAKAAKAKADGNITKTVTPKTKAKVVAPKAKVVAPKAKVVAPKAKPASTKPTTTTKPQAKTKLVNAPGAYTKSNEFKRSVSTFTSAADRLRAKGVANLKPTAPAKATAPKKPRTSSDKTANRRYEKEMRDYKRKNNTSESKQAKPKKRAAKGSRAATLKKGFGY
jgi:hypothetical protein